MSADLLAIVALSGAVSTVGGLVGFITYRYLKNIEKINTKISDKEIIELAKLNNGVLTPAIICEHTKLSLGEAKTKLEHLAMAGTISRRYDWTDWSGNKYTVAGYETNNFFSFLIPQKTTSLPTKKAALTDVEVIKYAVEMKGKLSIPALCVKANCTVDEAKAKLDELQKKDIFELGVAENGTYIYELTDKQLLR